MTGDLSRPDGGDRLRVPGELLTHLEQREHHAQTEVERLKAAIAELSEQLDQVQRLVDRLRLTRQTLLEFAEATDEQPDTIDTLPSASQDILAVFARTEGGLRAKDLCRTLNTGTEPATSKPCAPNSSASSDATSSPNPNRDCYS